MIVNPMFFYMMHVCGGMRIILFILSSVFIFAAIVLGITLLAFFLDNASWIDDDDDEDKNMRRLLKIEKMIAFTGLLTLIIGVCIPNKDTILMMQAANLATTENVNAIFEALKAAVDYAVSILQ